MQHTSQSTNASARNRATGYSDADWGQLEKRLTDTRDLLRDILLHLRKVLDNLKTAGAQYQSAGRSWRAAPTGGTKPSAGARQGGQFGYRPTGSAAGAPNNTGAARAQTTQKTTAARSATNQSTQRPGQDNYYQAGSSTFSSNTRSATAASSGKSGTSFAGKADTASGARPGAATDTAAGAAGSRYQSATSDRQAGAGFSWSSRTKADAASSASSGAGQASGAGAKGATFRERASQNFGQGASASSQRTTQNATQGATYSAGQNSGSASAGQQRAQQSRTQQARTEQESRHRTTGPGGGSSYQEYRQRNHKSPLGSGRMTLTQACALLCLTYPCSADEVKAAYRKQARRHHPDLGGDEDMMKAVNQAYEMALSWCSPLRGKAATWAA
jgi:hypothetical protein